MTKDRTVVPKKNAPVFDWTALPEELRSGGKFCLYRNQPNGNGKPKKVPYDAKTPNRLAKTNDPATWADWKTTQKAFEQYPFDGINAVCKLPFVFVDLDKCIDDAGNIASEAYEIIGTLPETYWETSPSGTGLHGIFYTALEILPIARWGVEVYSTKHFMSVTGRCVNGIRTIAKVIANDFDFLRSEAAPKVRSEGKVRGMVLEGQRTNTLLSIAGTMRRRGLDLESIEHAIRQYNVKHCSPPLDDKNIRGILKSIDKYKAAAIY